MSTNPPITCTRCGAVIAPGAHFCASCGLDISSPQGGVTTLHVNSPLTALRADGLLQALRDVTLGEYEVLGELGRGGMATVYLAHDIALDRKVAIKVMSPTLMAGEGTAERFKREARTAGQLSHPHIIPIYAVREHGELLYFVMKFIGGRSLDSIIREVGPLPIPMVQTILQQVGSALGYAHRRGVIHRDVKPANVMLDADGWAVVTDFGIAKVSETQGLTVTGATVGTPSYMSPEQCAAKELTGASDQYSLGIVAYEMLSGRLPFVAESVMAVMYAHFNEPPPLVTLARTDCPPALADAVMRMLEKDPAHRFPSMEAATAAAGGAPLAPDDPIRTQMITLAAKGESMRLLERFSTPVSQPSVGQSAGTSGRPPSIATLLIAPARVTITAEDAVQLHASAKSRKGQTLVNRPVSWASTNTDIAQVSSTGLVTAIAPGSVTITATSENTSATAMVTVTAARRGKVALRVAAGGVGLAVIAAALWLFGPFGRPGPADESETGASGAPPVPASQTVGAPPESAAAPADSTSLATASRDSLAAAAQRQRPSPPVAPQPQRTGEAEETAVAAAVQSARAARDHATAAGATEADLAAGDSELAAAERLRRAGRRSAALEHLLTATSLWSEAERTAHARAVAAAASRPTAPVTEPPATQPAAPTPQPVADPTPQIRDVIAAYGRALEKRDLAALKQVFPGISADQAHAWEDLFKSARDVHANLQATQIEPSGDRADVAVSGDLTYQNTNTRRQERLPITFRARLAHAGGGWVITAIH